MCPVGEDRFALNYGAHRFLPLRRYAPPPPGGGGLSWESRHRATHHLTRPQDAQQGFGFERGHGDGAARRGAYRGAGGDAPPRGRGDRGDEGGQVGRHRRGPRGRGGDPHGARAGRARRAGGRGGGVVGGASASGGRALLPGRSARRDQGVPVRRGGFHGQHRAGRERRADPGRSLCARRGDDLVGRVDRRLPRLLAGRR